MSGSDPNTGSSELFTIKRRRSELNNTSTEDSTTPSQQEIDDLTTDDREADAILCMLWKSGKLGAAYYKLTDHQLYVLKDIEDARPQFMVSKSLYREVNPKHTITVGMYADDFVKFLINLHEPDEVTINSDKPINLPATMSLLSTKDFKFDTCIHAVENMSLASFPENETDEKRRIYLRSLIDFECEVSLYALGALLRFLGQNFARYTKNNEQLLFLHIWETSLNQHVLMDDAIFKGLKIFDSTQQESDFKHTQLDNIREADSLFRIFAVHCKSQLSYDTLRKMLLKPIRDIKELNARLDFIQFAKEPCNKAFVQSLLDNIKGVRQMNVVLKKIANLRATRNAWQILYRTMYHIANIHNMCLKYQDDIYLFKLMIETVTDDFFQLIEIINKAIDFVAKDEYSGKPIIKFGLDQALDAKKVQLQDISKQVTGASNFLVDRLPDYVEECRIVLIPNVGHTITIRQWDVNCDPEQLAPYDLSYMFSLNGFYHYRNALCHELDNHIGDRHKEVIAHENRIIKRLAGIIVKHNKDIREPITLVGKIGALLAMAKAAELNAYVRPDLTEENRHAIVGGRHPLLERKYDDFRPNDFASGTEESRVKILTGPNGSGKSVYSKQTVMIMLMAHFGSFVPAERATIGMVHSFYCDIHALETVITSLSGFQADISQMSQALHSSKPSSVITIDEFGRGTTGEEGMLLLVGALRDFINRGKHCPHVILSTHIQEVVNHLPETPLVQCLKMNSIVRDNELVMLYQVEPGIADSYALEILKTAEFDDEDVARARELCNCLQMDLPLEPRQDNANGNGGAEDCVLTVPPLDVTL